MAKATPELWEKARALFEAGKSLSEISNATHIDKSYIGRKARQEAWEKGAFEPIIHAAAQSHIALAELSSTLSSTARTVVDNEIAERTKHIQFFNSATMKNLQVMMKKVDESTDIMSHRVAQAAIKDGRETVLGKQPDTAIQINNTQSTVKAIQRVIVDPAKN